MGFQPYGQTLRHLRRQFDASFPPTKLEEFRPIEKRAAHRLLRNLLSSPDNFSKHLKQSVAETTSVEDLYD